MGRERSEEGWEDGCGRGLREKKYEKGNYRLKRSIFCGEKGDREYGGG